MWIWILLLTLIGLTSPYSLVLGLQKVTIRIHQQCLDAVPFAKGSEELLWKALVCGAPIHDSYWSTTLKSSGLLHIFVVSGSHFLVLLALMGFFKVPRLFQIVTLILFNFMTDFSAPGTRALISVLISSHLRIHNHQKILCISLFTLGLNPDWIQSYSFWLSWLASLIMVLAPQDRFRISQNLLFFSVWQLMNVPLSFLSLVMNLLLAPLIGWILFPLALLSLAPPLTSFFEISVQLLRCLFTETGFAQKKIPFSFHLGGLAFITLMTHLTLQFFLLERQGRKIK